MPPRRSREPGLLRARRGAREDRRSVLIVCGGATERLYFQRLSRKLGLTSITTVVEDALHPTGIVERALTEERRADRPYDTVWAVLDKDEYPDFDDLVRNGRRLARPGGEDEHLRERVGMAYSNPCFEVWLLLHYGAWQRPCTGGEVDAAVRRIPALVGYRHGDDAFALVDDRRADAIVNALGLERRNREDGKGEGANPSTAVHRLVQYLQRLAPAR